MTELRCNAPPIERSYENRPQIKSHPKDRRSGRLYLQTPGSSCSKLMTSLVKVSLKFRTLLSEICQYFLLKKSEKLLQCTAKAFLIFFSTKNFSVFGYKVVKLLMS